MNKGILIFSFVLLISLGSMAQKQDSVPGKSLAEKGAQGDILLGKETKKNQLKETPQQVQAADFSQKKDIHLKKKKSKQKKI